ncbi:hypothetical protein LB507_009423, partial [Fusarium sp. FIESC RH6]
SVGSDEVEVLTSMLGISDNEHNGDGSRQEGGYEDQHSNKQDTDEHTTGQVTALDGQGQLVPRGCGAAQSSISGVSRNHQARHRDSDTKASLVADPLNATDGNELRLQNTATTATNRSPLLVAIVAVVSKLNSAQLDAINLLIPFPGHAVVLMAMIILCVVI